MWVIATTLASLAGLIIFVLWVPLDIVLYLDMNGRPKFGLRLAWLFGLVSKEIKRGKKKPEEKKRAAEKELKPQKRRMSPRTIFGLLRTKGLLKQFKRLLKDILGSFNIRDFRINLRVGLDNPADTGLLFAIVGPATHFLDSSIRHEVKLQPVFDRAVFEGYSYGAVRLRPILLVLPFLRFIFSPTTVRVVKKLISSKWKRKK